ncbi:hypothetical protein B0T21DRAFT_210562 [Apiosordaria backusii]|uniref:Uncharacterized protein n=1 Tax=Apiosordaria backusii TaxID=314023 RepID=A0AA40EBG8_9PEZI|nr:hypothetical protein B0T21DRAFT_210562 [Apiosordaria backusii]
MEFCFACTLPNKVASVSGRRLPSSIRYASLSLRFFIFLVSYANARSANLAMMEEGGDSIMTKFDLLWVFNMATFFTGTNMILRGGDRLSWV